MIILLIVAGILAAAYLSWIAMIVVRGNNYHALVKQSVLAELGIVATPYLESRPIVEQITNAFRRGDPASSTALALTMLIQQAETEDKNSN